MSTASHDTSGGDGAGAATIWLTLLGLTGAAIALVAITRLTARTGGATVPDFLRSRTRHSDDNQDEPGQEQGPDWVAVGHGIYRHSNAAELADAAVPPPEHADGGATESAPLELGQLGSHIASVLGAAEAAAKNLIADAEREANEAREEAIRVADDIRTRATEEAQAERASARRTIEEAERSAKSTRADAETYADARRREADAQAGQIIREAEQRASSLASSAEERHRVLLANIAASENRLRELAKSLRAVASSLDSVVGDRIKTASHEDSLEESLRPARQIAKPDRPPKEEVAGKEA